MTHPLPHKATAFIPSLCGRPATSRNRLATCPTKTRGRASVLEWAKLLLSWTFLKGLNRAAARGWTQTEGLSHMAGRRMARRGLSRIASRTSSLRGTCHPRLWLAVTFTKTRHPREMKEERVTRCWKTSIRFRTHGSRVNSYLRGLLRSDGAPLARVRSGFTRRFSIYDDENQLACSKWPIARWAFEEKDFLPVRVAARIATPKEY